MREERPRQANFPVVMRLVSDIAEVWTLVFWPLSSGLYTILHFFQHPLASYHISLLWINLFFALCFIILSLHFCQKICHISLLIIVIANHSAFWEWRTCSQLYFTSFTVSSLINNKLLLNFLNRIIFKEEIIIDSWSISR